MIARIWLFAVLLLAPQFAVAQQLAPMNVREAGQYISLGFCYLSSPSSATGFSGFTGTACTGANQTNGVPNGAFMANVCISTQAVNWRDDGVAPSATLGTGGMPFPAGSCMWYAGYQLSAVQYIQQTAGAVVSVMFYK